MTRPKISAILALALIAFAAFVSATEKTFFLPPETAKLKPGPGEALAGAQCLLCHSPDYLSTQPRLTRTVWKAEVLKMQQKYGAPIITNRVDELVDYLVKNYGQENPDPKARAK